MPALGKEIERQLTPDEIALKEIQGYIDRTEHQAETQQPQLSKPQQVLNPVQISQIPTMTGMAGIAPVVSAQKIMLPLDKIEVEGGLKKSVVDGVRWLSEWCVMMIKKYPGRVFYMSPNTRG